MSKFLWILALLPASAFAQCANTAYGNGFTCVQATTIFASSATVAATNAGVTLAAAATTGDGIIAFGNYCPLSGCAAGGSATPTSISDNVADTGWQPCAHNGSTAAGVRFWYCWWLPHVGAATTFTMRTTASTYALTLWVSEISGACNTTGCIDTDVAPAICGNPCTTTPMVTSETSELVIGFGYLAVTVLTPAAGWQSLLATGSTSGSPIAASQALPGTYTPTWTSTTSTAQTLGCAIKSLTSAVPITQVTVPSMPVF